MRPGARRRTAHLVESERGEAPDAFFSFFPEPGPLEEPLCLGEPLDFLEAGDSLELERSGDPWGEGVGKEYYDSQSC